MTKKPIAFADLRGLLQGLGYAERCTANAQVFHRAQKDMLVFRRYRDQGEITGVGDRPFATLGRKAFDISPGMGH